MSAPPNEPPDYYDYDTPTRTSGNSLPHAVDAERAVLGSLLVNYEYIQDKQFPDAPIPLIAEEFYDKRHKIIYATIISIGDTSGVVDPIFVAETMSKEGNLKKAGNADYIAELAAIGGAPVNVPAYIALIKEMYELRQIIITATDAQSKCFSPGDTSPKQIREDLQDNLIVLENKVGGESQEPIQKIGDIGKKMTDKIFDAINAKDFQEEQGIQTGVSFLDREMDGLRGGELTIIGARPCGGKTAIAIHIVKSAISYRVQGYEKKADFKAPSVLFISAEMTAESLCGRFIASLARINSRFYRDGGKRLWERDGSRAIDKLDDAAKALSEMPIFITDGPTSIATIRANVRRHARQQSKTDNPLKLVVVDYLQLIGVAKVAKKGTFVNREQEVAQITYGLKALAKEYGISIIALSQLNRGAETRTDSTPKLADLRESGAQEAAADQVILLHQDTTNNTGMKDLIMLKIIMAKNRFGETGGIDEVKFTPSTNIFENIAPAYAAAAELDAEAAKEKEYEQF